MESNKLICPECGDVRLETPLGTTPLPTIGMALKSSGATGACGCGKSEDERAGAQAPVEES